MAQTMSAREAAEVLAGLEGMEQTLAARAGGVTTMVWGLVSAGIFLTYGTADPYLEERGLGILFAFLWMPWVAAGVGLTGAVWSNYVVSLRRPAGEAKGVRGSLGFTALFLAIAAALFVGLDVVAGIEWSIAAIMTLTNGLFALVLAAFLRRAHGARSAPMSLAGVAMLAGGAALALTDLAHAPASLLAALLTGAGWVGAGAVLFVRG